jgi:hypothetical protein
MANQKVGMEGGGELHIDKSVQIWHDAPTTDTDTDTDADADTDTAAAAAAAVIDSSSYIISSSII